MENEDENRVFENYTRCKLPFRFHKQGSGTDEPPFDSCPIDVRIEKGGIFCAVPQSSFKNAEYVVEPDTYETYINITRK